MNMLSLSTVLDNIYQACLKRDMNHEMTEANSKLFQQWNGDTFEAIENGNNKEKYLIPDTGELHFLYRGQNEEIVPCIPSIFRGNPCDVDVFVERMRLTMFRRLLRTHPVINGFFKKNNFYVDAEGLAQHYGLKTSVLDLTSSLDVALFFAMCKYDKKNDRYYYDVNNEEQQAILYVFDPLFDNESSPTFYQCEFLNRNITPIGLQAFPRPGVQFGFSLHIDKGDSVRCWIYRFTFTPDDAKSIFEKFDKGRALWTVKDILIEKAKQIQGIKTFSFDLFNETYDYFRPWGLSRTKLKKIMPDDIKLVRKCDDIVFSEEERCNIKNEWNDEIGSVISSKIRRKPWFEMDGVDETTMTVKGQRNHHDYRTLKLIEEGHSIGLVAAPNALQGAEWVNYVKHHRRYSQKSTHGWQKVDAKMINCRGEQFLTEADWIIRK